MTNGSRGGCGSGIEPVSRGPIGHLNQTTVEWHVGNLWGSLLPQTVPGLAQ